MRSALRWQENLLCRCVTERLDLTKELSAWAPRAACPRFYRNVLEIWARAMIVERAARRATLLSKLGVPAAPVVAGKSITPYADELARLSQVQQIIRNE